MFRVAPLLLLIITIPLVYYVNVKPVLGNYHAVQAVITNKDKPLLMYQEFEQAFRYSPPPAQELRFMLIQHTRDKIAKLGINDETLPLIKFAISEGEKTLRAAPETIQTYLLLSELYLMTLPLDSGYLNRAEEISLAAFFFSAIDLFFLKFWI